MTDLEELAEIEREIDRLDLAFGTIRRAWDDVDRRLAEFKQRRRLEKEEHEGRDTDGE